nr:hypothetical protein [Cronobacter dublinensis]
MNKIEKALSFKGPIYQKASKITFSNKLLINKISRLTKRCEQNYHCRAQDNFMQSVDKSVQKILRQMRKTRRSAHCRCG